MVSCFYFGRKDTMPEHYKEHKVRINTIDILEQKVDLMVLLHPSTLTAPGLNMRDYFREFLSCWDMDKILKRIAEMVFSYRYVFDKQADWNYNVSVGF